MGVREISKRWNADPSSFINEARRESCWALSEGILQGNQSRNASSTMSMLEVVCPPGMGEGMLMEVNTPSGMMQVQIPQGSPREPLNFITADRAA